MNRVAEHVPRIPAHIRKGLAVRKAVAADRRESEIQRDAPRPDNDGWSICAGCDQSCTGAYQGKLGCHRCGIVGAR